MSIDLLGPSGFDGEGEGDGPWQGPLDHRGSMYDYFMNGIGDHGL